MKKLVMLTVALVLAPASAALAAGGGSTQGGYGGAAQVQGALAKSGGSGTLPFTGLSLALVVAVAVALIVAGALLRHGRATH